MKKIKKIALLTSGGDAPGMNAAIRSVVRTADMNQIEVFGAINGFKGLVENDLCALDNTAVANIIQRGGTILKSQRFPEFRELATRQQAAKVMSDEGIDALLVLGGDGSFRGASLLAQIDNIPTIGIPCTIDNDIHGTNYTIGFDTARNTAMEAIDKIRDTAFSHSVNFLVEVMGRTAGFLALDVGIAGGAEYILLPERAEGAETLIHRIQDRTRVRKGSIIVVSESDQPGRSFQIAKQIEKKTGIQYKVCVLGHTQRGGKPSARDRKIASSMGYLAVDALMKGETEKMVAYNAGRYELAAFPDPGLPARCITDFDQFSIARVLAGE